MYMYILCKYEVGAKELLLQFLFSDGWSGLASDRESDLRLAFYRAEPELLLHTDRFVKRLRVLGVSDLPLTVTLLGANQAIHTSQNY